MSDSKIPFRPAVATNDSEPPLARAGEVADLLQSIQDLIVPFIRAADEDADSKPTGHGAVVAGGGPRTTIIEHHPPHKLQSLMDLDLPDEGKGKEGLLQIAKQVLQYSVNTWDQGFMDKLYHGNNAIGLVSEILLATLNTNTHVYTVSPALTLIEKSTTRHLAELFGLRHAPSSSSANTTSSHPHPTPNPHAGGISQPGGSASNLLALLTARNTMFPATKSGGMAALGGKRLVIFASAHAHYSTAKAASLLGLGQDSVRAVPVDAGGRMHGDALAEAVRRVREEEGNADQGAVPFFVCATAGTTVLGSFDDLPGIADVCARERLWLHVDGSWGGPVVFSATHREKVKGAERADSIAITPHKMLGVPLTCSFLLVRDVRLLHAANRVSAGYLFHSDEDGVNIEDTGGGAVSDARRGTAAIGEGMQGGQEVWDLADLTPQCGRKGEALKMFLGWLYYGRAGYAAVIDRAYETTAYLANLVQEHPNMVLISEQPPPCLQVCFYYAKNDRVEEEDEGVKKMSKVTSEICRRLVRRGFMVDYAPGKKGMFVRVVVNYETRRGTVEGLLKAVGEEGEKVWQEVVER